LGLRRTGFSPVLTLLISASALGAAPPFPYRSGFAAAPTLPYHSVLRRFVTFSDETPSGNDSTMNLQLCPGPVRLLIAAGLRSPHLTRLQLALPARPAYLTDALLRPAGDRLFRSCPAIRPRLAPLTWYRDPTAAFVSVRASGFALPSACLSLPTSACIR